LYITAAELRVLAGQVRALDAALESHIERIRSAHLWQGKDANRYLADWDSDVHSRLLSAARGLENLSLVSAL
jgi:hypothetical protein